MLTRGFGKTTVRGVTLDLKGKNKGAMLALNRQVAIGLNNSPKIRKDVSGASARQIEKVATEHYKNAVYQVQHLLQSDIAINGIGAVNPTNTGAAAAKRIRFRDGDQKSRFLTTRPWNPLTYRYSMRGRPSFRYWKKQGKLGTAFASAASWKTARAFVKEDTVEDLGGVRGRQFIGPYNKQTGMPFKTKQHAEIGVRQQKTFHTTRMRIRHTASFSSLRAGVVDALVSESFVLGSERPGNSFKFGSGKLTGVDIIAYPELARSRSRIKRGKHKGRFARGARRPFIVQLSARLGRGMHTAIRRL